jgi:hypothetical protein
MAAGAASISATASRACSTWSTPRPPKSPASTSRTTRGSSRPARAATVLHDEMPLCAAARMGGGFPASHAALPRRRFPRRQAQLVRAPADRDRPQRQARRRGGAAGELVHQNRQRLDPAADGEGRRRMGTRRCSTPPASSTTTPASARRRARCWPRTASPPRWRIPAVAACRSSSKATSPASPRPPTRWRRRSVPISSKAMTWWRWCRLAR